MASILKVDDLRGNTAAGNITITSEGGAATMQLQQGLCKCWNFATQPSATIQDSFNISSMVDAGTGMMNHVYTKNMSNALYSGAFSLTNNVAQWWFNSSSANTNTSQAQTRTYTGSSYTDSDHKMGIFGDLA